MGSVTITRVATLHKAGKKPKGVTKRRVTAADGTKVTVRVIDANAASFSEDMLYVFKRNVAAARAENKKLLGSPSGVKLCVKQAAE